MKAAVRCGTKTRSAKPRRGSLRAVKGGDASTACERLARDVAAFIAAHPDAASVLQAFRYYSDRDFVAGVSVNGWVGDDGHPIVHVQAGDSSLAFADDNRDIYATADARMPCPCGCVAHGKIDAGTEGAAGK